MHFSYLALAMKGRAMSSRQSLFALLPITMAVVVGGASVISEPRSVAMAQIAASVELVHVNEEMAGKEVNGVEKDFDAMVVEFVGKGHDDGVVGTTAKVDTHPPDSIPADGDPHQDGALVADGSGGELTAKWPWRGCIHGNNMPGGRYCGTCGDSACRNHVCQFLHCRDCRHDSQCPSGRICDAVSANYRCVDKFNDGRACNQNRLCRSGHCHLGQCRTCRTDSHCASGQYCTGTYRCEDKGSINDYCDPTGLTNAYLHVPCSAGLSCYPAIRNGNRPCFKCLPSNNGCYARILSDYHERVVSAYADANQQATGRLGELSSTNIQQVVESISGGSDGLLDKIRHAACATRALVSEGMERLRQCQPPGEFANTTSLTATHGLDTAEGTGPAIFMLGGAVDATAGVMGSSLGFGAAIELDGSPQIALYISACFGPSFGWEASVGGNAAIQFGGGLDATAGWAQELFEANVGFVAGGGFAISFSQSNPTYVTASVGISGGGGADVDIGQRCFAWVSPTAQDVISAATCS